ncbi:hypothetical protein RHMOL_RhmolUnG0005000 [Rhododendron molle]|nr:hypothetical protein RHMOL_RhmolUnG0005000 [Rhododendron molle]
MVTEAVGAEGAVVGGGGDGDGDREQEIGEEPVQCTLEPEEWATKSIGAAVPVVEPVGSSTVARDSPIV